MLGLRGRILAMMFARHVASKSDEAFDDEKKKLLMK